jgi:hypothetical protein
MKNRVFALMLLLIILTALVACGQATPAAPTAAPSAAPTSAPAVATIAPTQAPATKAPAAAPTVASSPSTTLEISNGTITKTLVLADLQKLPTIEGWAGIKSSTGKITPPSRFKGVSLAELSKVLGPVDPKMGVNVVAKDGYAMTFSYDQITTGAFTAFDPATGDELKDPGKLTVAVVYERDGGPIPDDTDGALRLAIVGEKQTQVTDGHWSVKWVRKVVLKPLAAEWNLKLEGNIKDEVDRASFESCSAPKCHGVTWKDEKAQTWAGVPLWLVVGRMDDEQKHENGFNQKVADAGYDINVIAADGYTVALPSSKVTRNQNILLAVTVNGNPLQDKEFPLKLVGSDLDKKQLVGGVVKLTMSAAHPVASPAAPTVAPTAAPTAAPTKASSSAPAAGDTLTVAGAVARPATLSLDDVKKLGLVKLNLEHPKKGKGDYEGVRWSALLDLVQPQSGATKLLLTAKDGYKSELPLAAVRACSDCLITIAADAGSYSLAMPGMDGAAWARDVIKIDVQ